MPRTRYNERSWAIDVISEANILLSRTRRKISRAGGERTISSAGRNLFPDVLLFEGTSGASVLQGWELKMPDTPITDGEFIRIAAQKAKTLGLNSFLLWNANTAVLYRSEEMQDYRPVHAWPALARITAREHVEPNRADWVGLLAAILEDLEQLFQRGTLRGRDLIGSFSDTCIIDSLLENSGPVAQLLERSGVRDAVFAAELNQWWATVKGEYPLEPDCHVVLARLVLVSWINRFIFAHVLKNYYLPASVVDGITESVTIRSASSLFRHISDRCDFWSVFQPFLGEPCLNGAFWRQVTQLNGLLSQVRFREFDQDVLRRFLESAVVSFKRKLAGQYTTPSALADILVRLVLLDRNDRVIDPFCGTGTIARAAYNLKIECGLDPGLAHQGIWASDKFPFPLQVASIALSPPECMGMLLHVFKADALCLTPGQSVDLVDPKDGTRRCESLPRFRFVASNLPFVKQEDLDVVNPRVRRINCFVAECTQGNEELNPRSDLCAYIPFYLWRLLAENGRLGIVVSNAWLATEWGRVFREVLKKFYHIDKVIVSGAGRWFREADIVTSILILNRRAVVSEAPAEERTTFVRVEIPLDELAAGPRTAALAEHVLLDRPLPGVVEVRSYSEASIRELEGLGMQWSSMFAEIGWLPSIRDRLVRVDSLFIIQRGERRGWDPMFYPGPEEIIEGDYLRPVLKSPRSVDGLVARPDATAFCCDRSISELRRLGHRGAVAWIRRFAHAANEKGKALPEVLKRAGMEWYQMDASTLADLVMHINYDRRIFVARLRRRSFVNQRLTRLTARSRGTDLDLCHALLNSIVGVFYIEALGFGRGLGVLDLNSTKMGLNMQMLNPGLVSSSSRNVILAQFGRLLARPVEPILDELARPDRRRFEGAVLRAFGLEGIYDRVLRAFMTLYQIRKAVGR